MTYYKRKYKTPKRHFRRWTPHQIVTMTSGWRVPVRAKRTIRISITNFRFRVQFRMVNKQNPGMENVAFRITYFLKATSHPSVFRATVLAVITLIAVSVKSLISRSHDQSPYSLTKAPRAGWATSSSLILKKIPLNHDLLWFSFFLIYFYYFFLYHP